MEEKVRCNIFSVGVSHGVNRMHKANILELLKDINQVSVIVNRNNGLNVKGHTMK